MNVKTVRIKGGGSRRKIRRVRKRLKEKEGKKRELDDEKRRKNRE